MNSFCALDQSELRPGDDMVAGMSALRLRNFFEGFPSPDRRYSTITQAICSPHLWLLALPDCGPASCVIQST